MNRNYWITSAVMLLACLAASWYFYPQLPEKVPIHWGPSGAADGFAPKFWGVMMVPGIMLAMLALFLILPWLSPKHFSVENFYRTYLRIMILLMGLFAFIHGFTLWQSLQGSFDSSRGLLTAMCVFFALIGNLLGKVKRNFWVGIRTPWTIANDRVWVDTHRMGARIFVLTGIVGAIMVWVPFLPAWSPVALIVIAAFLPVIYSVVHYKKLEKQGMIT